MTLELKYKQVGKKDINLLYKILIDINVLLGHIIHLYVTCRPRARPVRGLNE